MDLNHVTGFGVIDETAPKEYIGDGVYVIFDGYGFLLVTQRGQVQHFIYLEPSLFNELNRFVRRISDAQTSQTVASPDVRQEES